MGSAKWIGGLLGWVTLGPLGGLLGFLVGSALDGASDTARRFYTDGQQGHGYANGGHGGYGSNTGRGGYSAGGARSYSAGEQRNSFLLSLLVLSEAVIKADGKTQQSEIKVVLDFVRQNFGAAAVPEAERILQRLSGQQINIYEVGPQVARYMNYSQRLQLFHYLVQIAVADGQFAASEKSVLEAIAGAIGLSPADAASVIAMFYKDSASAYAVLEISPSATDDEVRSAYRRMAMKNHPDKVATLGPEVQKAAEEKFRRIQEAYETIKKERGLN